MVSFAFGDINIDYNNNNIVNIILFYKYLLTLTVNIIKTETWERALYIGYYQSQKNERIKSTYQRYLTFLLIEIDRLYQSLPRGSESNILS